MYEYSHEGITKSETKGDPTLICNFTAQINEEIKYVDGKSSQSILKISGKLNDEVLPEIEVPSEKFASLSWVTPNWGVGPVISPIANAERDIRAAIQLNSKPTKTSIYTHTGWTKIGGKDTYLFGNGGVSKDGLNTNIQIQLPTELNRFETTEANSTSEKKKSIQASINFKKIGPSTTTWPMLLATYRGPIGPCDYAIHVAGRSGTYKSEAAALLQSHFGGSMDARSLPGSWSSTANALEAQAYKCKNALFVIDDFVPYGTAYQVRAYQKTADQLFRGQGNQSGRARLTDVSALQATMYPRGVICSTGEDIPVGQSVRARMNIIELTPGDITPEQLTIAQREKPMFAKAMSEWIKWLDENGLKAIQSIHRDRRTALRNDFLQIGHARTPAMIADMVATAELLTAFAAERNAISKTQRTELVEEATNAIIESAKMQSHYLETQDPTENFLSSLKLLFDGNTAHLRAIDGGIPPQATRVGWTKKDTIGTIPTYTAHGPKIGWIDTPRNAIYLEPNVTFMQVTKAARGTIAITKQTMFKRLKDAGLLTATDEQRQRNTIRVQCEGRTQVVLSLSLASILNEEETE